MGKRGGAGIIIAIVIGLIVIGGGVYYFLFLGDSVKNCENERKCIVDAMRACELSKGTVTTDGAGNPSRETYIEVLGLEGNRCKMHIKNQDKQEMTCLIGYQLYEGYDDWGGYNVLVGLNGIRVSALDSCNGDLKDALENKFKEVLSANPSAERDKTEITY